MSGERMQLSTTVSKTILVFAVAISLCFAAVFSCLFYLMHENEAESHLSAMAAHAAGCLDGSDLDNDIRILGEQLDDDVRYTLIDGSGQVVFDSIGEATGDHSDRPEFIEARESGTANVVRHSSTLGEDTIYAAVALDTGIVLRLSEQRASFLSVFSTMAPALGFALIAVAIIAVALSRLLTRKIVAPFDAIDASDPLNSRTYKEMQPLLVRIGDQQQKLRDQNAELARAEDMRREFSANVSHEMKTPLQVIAGYAELMAQGLVAADDVKKFSTIIFDEAENMEALIDDVLVLSRLDDPVMENAGKEEVGLLALAYEVAKRLERLAEKRSVRLRVLGSEVTIYGNRQLLIQLVANLVSNAIRYSDENGEVVIGVGKTLLPFEDERLPEAYIKVKDEGCGIPEEDVEKIFERFYRVDKSRSKESGGTGLGLAIAKHAADFHGAYITVDSEVGEGSVFTVHFPQ